MTVACRDPSSGVIDSLEAKLTLSDTNYKNTPKVTWLAVTDHAPATPTVCVIFDNLITKGVLKPEDDFKDFVNYNSKVVIILKKLLLAKNPLKFLPTNSCIALR